MSAEQKCRVCGCTENNACVTAAGVCHWTEPDLCSAHAAREAVHQLCLSEADVAALQQLPPIGVEIGSIMAFHILAALQLACRHPGMAGPIRHSVMQFAGGLVDYLSVTENLAALCEAGWRAEHDVAAVPERRIILPGD